MSTWLLDLRLVLPNHAEHDDICITRLAEALHTGHGIARAHVKVERNQPLLCVHYNPALLTPESLKQITAKAGVQVQGRYKHATLQLTNLHRADCTGAIEGGIGKMAGVFNVSVNHATKTIAVTYDQQTVGHSQFVHEIEVLGYSVKHNGEVAGHQRNEGTTPTHKSAGRDDTYTRNGQVLGVPPDLFLSLLSGAALVVGWFGERYLGLPFVVALALYLIAYVAGGYNTSKNALGAAVQGHFDIDVLMVVAAIGAASLGDWPEGALLLFLFSLGNALEHYAMGRARNAIRALAALAPKTARVRRADKEQELPISELVIGDIIIVRPGERLPADGVVMEGSTSVDQSPITGESIPVAKNEGDQVYAGTINGDGSLILKTTKSPQDTTLSRVIKMVEQAQTAKSPSQRFTDRFQRIFTPAVLGATGLLIALPPLFGFPFAESFIRAMTLLVAASPCALALATPSAILSGIARAARSGVLIKGGVHLENAGTTNVVVFDKTGTLTEGRPEVTDLWPLHGSADDLLALAAAVESKSGHPLAKAIVQAAEAKRLLLPSVGNLNSLTGKGVEAFVDGQPVRIGNRTLMKEAGILLSDTASNTLEALERDGKTSILIAHGTALRGILALRDEPRSTAKAAIAALKTLGVQRTVMLTGDNRLVAEAIGRELGLDEVRAELLPEGKVAAIAELRERFGKVIMIGDGVNDAPAMVEATTGIAMGGAGTDVALETADIALMADDLSRLPYALSLSRASRRMIVQNLWISLGVIAFLVPSAALGLVGISAAIVLHEGSTLVVVVNALRLLGFKQNKSPLLPNQVASGPAGA